MASLNSTNTNESKTSATPNTTLVTIRNSESLYLLDGDIVLLSLPKDNVITAFKVDRVFLRRSSPVFEGMLSSPPPEDIETYDNVPCVKLQDDVEDLTMFLMALYDSRCLPWKKYDSSAIRTAEGILFLANKYQVDHLRERIVDLLERDWPSNLSNWDDNEAERRSTNTHVSDYITELNTDPDAVVKDRSIPDPCEVIRLARRCNLPSILPAAFYHLSRIPATKDCNLSYYFTEVVMNTYDGDLNIGLIADFSLLSAEDFRRLVVGREAMLSILRGYLRDDAVEYEHEHSPSNPAGCSEKGLGSFKDWFELRTRSYLDDPLSMMKRGADDPRHKHIPGTCRACRGKIIDSLDDNRKALWEQLPVMFLLNHPV